MFDKNISFWCVVLFFVIAMVIHHILSQKSIIEGNENQDENSGNIDMSKVKSFEFSVKGPPDQIARILGNSESGKGTELMAKPDAPEDPDDPEDPDAPDTPVAPGTPASPDTPAVQMIQPVDEGLYHHYQGLLEFEGVGASKLGCKGVKNVSGGDSLTVQQAKELCNITEDCDGFFHFNSTGSDKTCFKKDVDVNGRQLTVNSSHGDNAGFHVVHGEKPPMWVLGETNQNCNEVCSAKGGDLKCLSGNWKMSKDEYTQALFDGGLKDEDNVNTVADVETWCGKISVSTSPTRPGTGNTPTNETKCFYTNNTTSDCESKHSITRRLCKCGLESVSP